MVHVLWVIFWKIEKIEKVAKWVTPKMPHMHHVTFWDKFGSQINNIQLGCIHQNIVMHNLCMVSKFWGQGGETEVSHFTSVNGWPSLDCNAKFQFSYFIFSFWENKKRNGTKKESHNLWLITHDSFDIYNMTLTQYLWCKNW